MLRLTVHLHIEYLYVLVIIVEWGRSRVPVQAPLAYLRDRGGMSIEMCLAAFKALGERWDARKCVIANQSLSTVGNGYAISFLIIVVYIKNS
jgi:hypothetical protein